MRIVYVVFGELMAGVFTSQVLEGARRVAAAGHEVHLVVFRAPREALRPDAQVRARMGACAQVFASCAFPVHGPRELRRLGAAARLARVLRRVDADLVHARGPEACALALAARGGRARPAVLLDARGLWAQEWAASGGYAPRPLPGKRLSRAYARARAVEAGAVRGADQVCAVTRGLAQALEGAYGRDLSAAAIVPSAVDAARYRFDAQAREAVRARLGLGKGLVWVYLGSAAAWQAPQAMLRAAAARLGGHPAERLLVVTSATERFESLADRAGVPAGQRVIVRAHESEVPGLLCAADAGLVLREASAVNRVAWPVKLAEYLAAGLPVVVTDTVDAAAALVRGRGWGRVASAPQAAAEAMEALAADLPVSEAGRLERCAAAAPVVGWQARVPALLDAYARACEPPAGFVAHVNHAYPVPTETFTRRTVAGLREAGTDVRVFSMRPGRGPLDAAAHEEAARTRYLSRVASARTAWANLRRFAHSPGTWLRWLARCAFSAYARADGPRRRAQSVAQFLRAAVLADTIAAEAGRPHVHAQFADGAATTALVCAQYLGAGFSFSSHTSYNPQLLAHKLRAARFVASVSEFDRCALAAACPEAAERIRIVHCGVDPAAWPQRTGPGTPGLIVSIGTLSEKKGHHVLLAACARLHEQGRRVRCRIVGAGPWRARLQAQRDRLGLRDAVIFEGERPEPEVRALLARAAVFALACAAARGGDLDGIPVALMEAMAAGVPVVSTRLSGIPELVEDGVAGRLVAPGDAEALARALARVLDDPHGAARLARAAREHVAAHFDLRTQTARLAQCLAEAQR